MSNIEKNDLNRHEKDRRIDIKSSLSKLPRIDMEMSEVVKIVKKSLKKSPKICLLRAVVAKNQAGKN